MFSSLGKAKKIALFGQKESTLLVISRKRHLRFALPVARSTSMSVCFFQAGKVLSSFFLFTMNNCMRSSVVRSPVIGDFLPERLNWKPYFPGMYHARHAKEQISENCSRSIMPNILTAISCLPSNGLSLNIGFTLRLQVMSSTMPTTRCILILPAIDSRFLMKLGIPEQGRPVIPA